MIQVDGRNKRITRLHFRPTFSDEETESAPFGPVPLQERHLSLLLLGADLWIESKTEIISIGNGCVLDFYVPDPPVSVRGNWIVKAKTNLNDPAGYCCRLKSTSPLEMTWNDSLPGP